MAFSTLDRQLLRYACRMWGIQTCYLSPDGHWVHSKSESLSSILSSLTKTEILRNDDLEHLICQRRDAQIKTVLEPVITFWKGQSQVVRFSLPLELIGVPAEYRLVNEHQELLSQGHFQLQRQWVLPDEIPIGYYCLEVFFLGRSYQSLLILAPPQIPEQKDLARSWGPFIPLYGLRSKNDWGLGSLTDLKTAGALLHDHGAKWVGTLPLLASAYDHPHSDPSPYSALSRLFWNEIFLDIELLIQQSSSEQAKFFLKSAPLRQHLEKLQSLKQVDYHSTAQLKNRALALLAENFFASGQDKLSPYQEFLRIYEDLDAYVNFRERDPVAQNRHRYAQFQMHLALKEFSLKHSPDLYMDYPIGVSSAGFDFHRYRESFFSEVSAGAPPEPVFIQGQNWGFPVLHPISCRQNGYDYFRKTLTRHLRYSRMLRLDHVMGLHRIFVIPQGKTPHDGAYLRYKPDELFAIVVLEATRAGAEIVGENLGVVPERVNTLMTQRRIHGMSVAQFEMGESPENFQKKLDPQNLLCINTHDLPTFSGFCSGNDLALSKRLGLLAPSLHQSFKETRDRIVANWRGPKNLSNAQLLLRIVQLLAQSTSPYLVVNIEDLWSETEPQNVPGTWNEVPNWRRKLKHALEEWPHLSLAQEVFEILRKNRP